MRMAGEVTSCTYSVVDTALPIPFTLLSMDGERKLGEGGKRRTIGERKNLFGLRPEIDISEFGFM